MCSISPEPYEWFSPNFPQIILSIRWYVRWPLIQQPSLKVTVLGHRIYAWILCLVRTSWTLWELFSLVFTQIFPSVSWCAEPMTSQIHTSPRSYFKVMEFIFQFHVSLLCPLRMIFIKLHSDVPLSEMMSRTQDSATQTWGHTSRSKDSAAGDLANL